MPPVFKVLVLALALAPASPVAAQNLNDVLRGEVNRAPSGASGPTESRSALVGGGLSAALGAGRGGRHLEKAELRDLARRSTVFIVGLSKTDAGTSVNMGSGFFIDPVTILTNSHVASGQSTLLVSAGGQGYVTATLASDSNFARNRREDFAVLKLEAPIEGTVSLPLGGAVDSLQDVIVAGYPGMVTDKDQRAADFLAGDVSAVPELVISAGTVQNVIESTEGVEMVTHSATSGPGNSGGPVLNVCGQVVGVHSQGSQQDAQIYLGNEAMTDESGNRIVAKARGGFGFAQSVNEMTRFLQSRHHDFQVAGGCRD